MSAASDRLLRIAKSRAFERTLDQQAVGYEYMAEFFRRLSSIDEQSLGPELAKLQCIASLIPPRQFGLRGRIRSFLLASISPVLGKLLRAASLASPYQAAYELAVQMQEQQLNMESRICSELQALNAKINELESEMNTRRRAG